MLLETIHEYRTITLFTLTHKIIPMHSGLWIAFPVFILKHHRLLLSLTIMFPWKIILKENNPNCIDDIFSLMNILTQISSLGENFSEFGEKKSRLVISGS